MDSQTAQMLVTIGSILIPTLAGFGWMINRMDKKFDKIEKRLEKIESRLTNLEKEIIAIKTIMFANGLLVPELVSKNIDEQ